MDIGTLATVLVGGRTAEIQLAIAARMLRMNADTAASVLKMIEAAQQNMDRLANVAVGVGGNLDVSA